MPECEVFVDGRPRKIELTRNGQDSFTVKVDGKTRTLELESATQDLEKPFIVKIDGKNYHVEIPKIDRTKEFPVKVENATFKAEIRMPARKSILTTFEPLATAPTRRATGNRQLLEGTVIAPMTGKIVSARVRKGDQVKAGQVVCVIEAMKMENEIAAPKAGTVKEVYVTDGSSVSEGEPLLLIS